MPTCKVLAVDDEPQILAAVRRGLGRAGHEVSTASTGDDAIAMVAASPPDLVVLDLQLPDMTGIDVVRRVREWSQVPIVFLSGSGTDGDRIRALDAGADDYLEKPFSLDELRARVEAVLRRSTATTRHREEAATLRFGDVTVDLEGRAVEITGTPVRLTPTQFNLLAVLVRHPGRIVTHQMLLTEVWGAGYGDESKQTLRAHIRQLRARLGDDAEEPRYLATEPGIGYRWIART